MAKKANTSGIHANILLKLLADRHTGDVFIPECKTGPSQTSQHSRMDAWVMNRSWAHATCTAYEIKVARSDFMQDTKWNTYLDFCNQFYFVCPPGLIQTTEVPDVAGLMWCSQNATGLFIKKKAPYRTVNIPESIFRYALMCRTAVTRETTGDPREYKRSFWQQWLENQKIDRQLGYRVSKTLAQVIEKKVLGIEERLDKMTPRCDNAEWVVAELKKVGLSLPYSTDEWNRNHFKKSLKMLLNGFDSDLEARLRLVKQSADSLLSQMKTMEDAMDTGSL